MSNRVLDYFFGCGGPRPPKGSAKEFLRSQKARKWTQNGIKMNEKSATVPGPLPGRKRFRTPLAYCLDYCLDKWMLESLLRLLPSWRMSSRGLTGPSKLLLSYFAEFEACNKKVLNQIIYKVEKKFKNDRWLRTTQKMVPKVSHIMDAHFRVELCFCTTFSALGAQGHQKGLPGIFSGFKKH